MLYSFDNVKRNSSLNVAPNTMMQQCWLPIILYMFKSKDLGGALEFNANFTEEFYNQWTEAYETYLLAKRKQKNVACY